MQACIFRFQLAIANDSIPSIEESKQKPRHWWRGLMLQQFGHHIAAQQDYCFVGTTPLLPLYVSSLLQIACPKYDVRGSQLLVEERNSLDRANLPTVFWGQRYGF